MFLILLNIMILFCISFFILKKKLSLPENLFIFMIEELMITSYFSILYINLKVWVITDQIPLFIIFRLYEFIVIPLLYVMYFNLLAAIQSRFNKWLFTITYVGILYGVEFLLVLGKVIRYSGWHFWQSLILIASALLVSYILQLGFRQIIRKGGI